MLYSLILIRKRKTRKHHEVTHAEPSTNYLLPTWANHLTKLHYSLQNIQSKFPSNFPKLKHPYADTCKQMLEYTQKHKPTYTHARLTENIQQQTHPHKHPPTNKHKYIDTCHHTHTNTKIRKLLGARKLHKRSRELLLTICVPLKKTLMSLESSPYRIHTNSSRRLTTASRTTWYRDQ
jgi:hypothetical protein